MASEVIAFPVNLRKNKNQYSPAYGTYFPEVDTKEPLNLKVLDLRLTKVTELSGAPFFYVDTLTRKYHKKSSIVSQRQRSGIIKNKLLFINEGESPHNILKDRRIITMGKSIYVYT